jgi:hypothetical protein
MLQSESRGAFFLFRSSLQLVQLRRNKEAEYVQENFNPARRIDGTGLLRETQTGTNVGPGRF